MMASIVPLDGFTSPPVTAEKKSDRRFTAMMWYYVKKKYKLNRDFFYKLTNQILC